MSELTPGYSYRMMSTEEMRPLFRQHLPVVFSSGFHLDAGYAFSETERRELVSLGERLSERYTLSLGIFYRDEHGDKYGENIMTRSSAGTSATK